MRKTHNQCFVRFGRHGRLMKDDQAGGQGGGSGATPPSNPDNNGGNSAPEGSESSGGDNTGEEFDPNAFWASPAPAGTAAPSGESAGGGQQESGTAGGEDLNTVLSNQLNSMTFGESVFTPEVAAEINEGNFAGFQKRLDSSMQAAVRNALSMNVQILRPFAEQLMTQMRDEFSGTLNNRDNSSALETDFPAAKNPAARPMIQQLYDQALKNTKGDRTKAVQQTKGMIRFMAGATADDLDLNVAPRGADDNRPAASNFNWLDELTGR